MSNIKLKRVDISIENELELYYDTSCKIKGMLDYKDLLFDDKVELLETLGFAAWRLDRSVDKFRHAIQKLSVLVNKFPSKFSKEI